MNNAPMTQPMTISARRDKPELLDFVMVLGVDIGVAAGVGAGVVPAGHSPRDLIVLGTHAIDEFVAFSMQYFVQLASDIGVLPAKIGVLHPL